MTAPSYPLRGFNATQRPSPAPAGAVLSMTDDHDDKIEYRPNDEPIETRDGLHIHVYSSGVVPDVIVWEREGDERFDLWGYQGHNGMAVLCIRTIHRHPPDYDQPDCEKWSVFENDGFPPIEHAPETPDKVTNAVIDWTDAPVADKAGNDDDDE